MSSEYRFLRFEIAGLATLFLYVILIIPVAWNYVQSSGLQNLSVSLAAVATLFLASVPLGYWEHQLVVDVYRSGKRPREVHRLIDKIAAEESKKISDSGGTAILEGLNKHERVSFLTALVEVCIFSGNISNNVEIFGRISERWSHFYARKAVGLFSPVLALAIFVTTLLVAFAYNVPFKWINIGISLVAWLLILALNLVIINPYSNKIWSEISYLETELILSNEGGVRSKVADILKSGGGFKQELKMESGISRVRDLRGYLIPRMKNLSKWARVQITKLGRLRVRGKRSQRK